MSWVVEGVMVTVTRHALAQRKNRRLGKLHMGARQIHQVVVMVVVVGEEVVNLLIPSTFHSLVIKQQTFIVC